MSIETYLIENDLTQADVARRIGISRQYLNQIVRGKRKAPRVRHKLVKLGLPIPKRLVQQRRAA